MTAPKIRGYKTRVTKKGFRVIEIDAWADPDKDEAWLAEARRTATSESDFQREVLRNWSISGGDAYYAEFVKFGSELYEFAVPQLLDLPIVRGWDFGIRMPVCIWGQYSATSDRFYVIREWAPEGIAAHHFRDVSRWLSGQIIYDALDQTSREWADMLLELPGPKPPWFPPGCDFFDYTGNEIENRQSIAAKDPREATLRQVWSNAGIEFSVHTGGVKARCDVLRRLLYPRADGRPGILVDPSCTLTLAMLNGGLVYQKGTMQNPKPEVPKKDGRSDNVNDALTYAVVGVVPASAPDEHMAGWDQEDIGWSVE